MEGASDLLYLRWASRLLENRGQVFLNRRWTITPVGGIDKIGTFAALFGGNKLHIAVLTDFRKGQKAKVRTLHESDLLRANHVFTAPMFTGLDEADIEDILGDALYTDLVNSCYSLKGKRKFSRSASTDPAPIVPDVEAHFKTLAPSDPEFDYYTPAVYLIENWSELSTTVSGADEALDRFEQFFREVNALLP